MKASGVLAAILFVSSLLVPVSILLSDEPASEDTERWDVRMVNEVGIWRNLTGNYFNPDTKEHWPGRRIGLKKLLKDFPDSRWADDAALVFAWGRVVFEDDVDGAIADLERIVSDFPDGHTVVSHSNPEGSCRLEETWLLWQRRLVELASDGTVKSAKPFDSDGELSFQEQEALTYFAHMDRYPRSTKTVAKVFMAELLAKKGDKAGAAAVLEQIVSDAAGYLPAVSKADRIAGSKPDGVYFRRLLRRPEYQAYLMLIAYYEAQGDVSKAAELADEFINTCSADGWLWEMNEYIGDFYGRHNLKDKAKEQFELALAGLATHEEENDRHGKLVSGSDIVDSYWSENRLRLKDKLAGK